MRLELTRAKAHYPLKVARLPIPPSGHVSHFSFFWNVNGLERKTGLEPATPTLARLCSTNWAIFANCRSLCFGITSILKFSFGAKNGTRTRDPNLGKVVLYQLSYFRVWVILRTRFCRLRCKGTHYFWIGNTLCDFFWNFFRFLLLQFFKIGLKRT